MITLVCQKKPRKAKYLTIGNEYTGQLLDQNGNNIDSFDKAEYFHCSNDTGSVYRYFINLFSMPEQKETIKNKTSDEESFEKLENEFIKKLEIDVTTDRKIRIYYKNESKYFCELYINSSGISCGVKELYYLNALIGALFNKFSDFLLINRLNKKSIEELYSTLGKACVKIFQLIGEYYNNRNENAFIISLLAEYEDIWPFLDEFNVAKDVPVYINHNSDNPNKLFIIPCSKVYEK